MSQENVDLVRGMYESFAAGDVPAVLESFDPEIVWNEAENFPYADGNPYVGPEAVVEGVFARLGSEWEYWNLEIAEILDAGNRAVAMGRYRAKNKQTGKVLNAQFAHVWTIVDGKAKQFQQYADTAQTLAAVRS